MTSGGRIAGRAGIVTGAARGIGEATAVRLGADGARLVLSDINEAGVERVAKEIGKAGGEAIGVPCDVCDYSDVERLAKVCEEEFGPAYFAIANAGIADWSLMSDGDPDHWRRLVETNLLGAAYLVRAVLGEMKSAGEGHIVLMASIAGREAWVGEPIYIAAKHGLVGLGRSLALECDRHGIMVTLIEPGAVDTELVRATEQGRQELETLPSLAPADVADAVAYALDKPPGIRVDELMVRAIGTVS